MWDLRLTEGETRALAATLAFHCPDPLGTVRSRLDARIAVWDANSARRAHREIAAMAAEVEGPEEVEEAEWEGDGASPPLSLVADPADRQAAKEAFLAAGQAAALDALSSSQFLPEGYDLTIDNSPLIDADPLLAGHEQGCVCAVCSPKALAEGPA